MRNGDAYKIQGLAKIGVSDSDICKHPQLRKYTTDEIMRFIPAKVYEAKEKTKKKKKAKAKAEDE